LPGICSFRGRFTCAGTVKPLYSQAFFLFGTALAALHPTLQRAARGEASALACAVRRIP
jgi:hypothetical protein